MHHSLKAFAARLLAAQAALFALASVSVASEPQVDAASVIFQVRDELAARGVELVVVHLPMRYELYPEPNTPFYAPMDEPHPNTVQARRLDLQMRLRGLRTIDLYNDFLSASTRSDIYKENRFHVKREPLMEIGARVATKLRSQKVFWREEGPSDVVFLGDCFANEFAEAARNLNQVDNIRSLIKFAGGGQAHNHLFAFEDEYLKDTDVVVWFLGDRNLCGHSFAPLCLSHSEEKLETKVVQARIVKMSTITKKEVTQMNYPNATRATLFERLDTGEHFIGIDYIVRDRKFQNSRMFKENYRVQLSLASLNAFERVNPEIAREYLIDQLKDYESPRYWIQGWLDLRPPDVVQITLQ